MNVPASRDPRPGSSRWQVVRYALTSNARTARFCLIWLVMTGGPVGAVLAWLISHIRLRAACSACHSANLLVLQRIKVRRREPSSRIGQQSARPGGPKVRVRELAAEFGVTSAVVMQKLKETGEFVRSASSTVEAPVARVLREYFARQQEVRH